MKKYALFSVTDKSGIVNLAKKVEQTHTILASGGTAKTIEEGGIEVTKVSEFIESPEMFGGRVKTLHPKIYGGILYKSNPQDQEEAEKYNIPAIDLVVCNLYQFRKAISNNPNEDYAIEHIDIGGPTLIRAAAKNFDRVTVVVDPSDYPAIIEKFPNLSKQERRKYAKKAFALVTNYDIAITEYLTNSTDIKTDGTTLPTDFVVSGTLAQRLKYGENPHQQAALYTSNGIPFFENYSSNKVSYNNLLDMTAGWYLAIEFDEPCCVIIKHRSPCGAASAENLKQAYLWALETDKMSAYGGVYVFNKIVDEDTASELVNMFVDVLLAPGFTDEALKKLRTKEKMKILQKTEGKEIINDITTVPDGLVVQEKDYNDLSEEQFEIVSEIKPSNEILEELKFAWRVVKHARSNAIAITKGTKALGIGSGQTSRVDATDSAIKRSGDDVTGAVLASDAFFPFPDSIEKAAKAGIKAVISPKGSIRDQQVIDAANENGLVLVFTAVRAFKH